MKKINLLLVIITLTNVSIAQRMKIDWDSSATIHKVCNEAFLKESAIVLLERQQIEFSYNLQNMPICTKRIHKRIKVNDEKGIEMYNKIKFNYYPDYTITIIKARTILPNGKVIELKPDAFKDLQEENGSMNKVFAMEGIEKGAEVEYVIHMRYPMSYFGNYLIQDIVPTCKSEYEIVSPSSLVFELKGYQQVSLDKDSTIGEKNSVFAHAENLPGLEEEPFASFLPHFARVEYSLAYNLDGKGKDIRILTWDDAAKNIYKSYSTFTDKELKAVNKRLDENKDFKKTKDQKEKVEFIEQFVKTNFVQQDYVADENATEIEYILKNKLTNETGIKQLFSAMFTAQKIPFEIGYTSDRMTKPFDYSFANWDNLKNCIYYFPEIKQYMAPNEMLFRSPFIPAQFCAQDAFFCKVIRLGEAVTATAEKRRLPEFKAEDNYHNHDVEVSFNREMDTSIIQLKNTFNGYNAIEFLPIFIYLDKDKREEAVKQIIRLSDKEEKMDQFVYTNADFSSIPQRKPLIVSATIHATNTIEKAGNKYLFRIGELIGRQSEMYQEKERQFDLEIPNPHQYTRQLKINIPEGFKASNLEKLNMNVLANDNGKESCKFTSTYVLKGNILEVSIFEIYHQSYTPKSAYEAYRKVINAAADFNKIVIVLEKS